MKIIKLERENLFEWTIFRNRNFSFKALGVIRWGGEKISDTTLRQLKNKHQVTEMIENYKKRGCIHNCAKFYIEETQYGDFYPSCKDNSLIWDKQENSDDKKLVGCSKNCHYYEPVWKRQAINKKNRCVKRAMKISSAVWREFKTLPVAIQVIIWIALFLLFFPSLLNNVIDIYKMIK